MPVRSVHDRTELAQLLRADPALHTYELGDLDDSFWPYTTWYRRADNVALLYHGAGTPMLIALDRPDRQAEVAALLAAAAHLLPARFTAQVTAGTETALADRFRLSPPVPHLKMVRAAVAPPANRPAHLGHPLDASDAPDLVALFDAAYPGHTFHPRMMSAGPYLGARRHGALVAAAGTHVWSPTYRVAALGNVVTHPHTRGNGLATALVAQWLHTVGGTVDHVALNVRRDNHTAVGLYARLGFTTAGHFIELTATAR